MKDAHEKPILELYFTELDTFAIALKRHCKERFWGAYSLIEGTPPRFYCIFDKVKITCRLVSKNAPSPSYILLEIYPDGKTKAIFFASLLSFISFCKMKGKINQGNTLICEINDALYCNNEEIFEINEECIVSF